MNYGEALAYWYLRLNGCFPLADFVMHRGETLKYTSDCDVLAVRPPYVSEEIGGQPDDWDPRLSQFFENECTLGIICEAKTGAYDLEKLFKAPNLIYSVRRLGLVDKADEAACELTNQLSSHPWKGVRFLKVLLANDTVQDKRFLCISFEEVRSFLRSRFQKYKESKFQDRMFFPSEIIQNLIDEVHGGTRPQRKLEEPPIEA